MATKLANNHADMAADSTSPRQTSWPIRTIDGMEEIGVQFPLAPRDATDQRPAMFLFSGVGIESECGYAPRVGGLVYEDLVHDRLPEVADEPVCIQGDGSVPQSFGQ